MEEILKQILGEIQGIKTDIQNMKADIQSMKGSMATKDDIATMATKDDIADMAAKDDIADMAAKDDIASIKNMLNGAMDIIDAYHEVKKVRETVNVHSEIIKDLSARTYSTTRKSDC